MKPSAYILLILLTCLSLTGLQGQRIYTPTQVPNVQISDGRSFVSNPDGILSATTVNMVNGILQKLRNDTGAEVAVVAISSIGSDSPESFTEALFQRWQLGKKGKDNGLLILLVAKDRILRFEVGYGMEGTLTDAISKRIQTQYMNPYFSSGNWDQGMLEGIKAIDQYLRDPANGLELVAGHGEMDEHAFYRSFFMILGAMFLIVIMSLIASRRKNKCPRCKKAKMVVIDETSTRISPGLRRVTTTYRCPNCGYVMKKDSMHNIGGGIAGGLGGGIGGGLGGFGSGRGGGFGGGWGGGRSGGGGATSRF